MKQPISLVWMQNWGRILTLPSSRGAFLSFFWGENWKCYETGAGCVSLLCRFSLLERKVVIVSSYGKASFLSNLIFLFLAFLWKSSVLFGISLEINTNRFFTLGVFTVCNAGGTHHPFGCHDAGSIRIFILFKNNLLDSRLYECFCTFVAGKESCIDPSTFQFEAWVIQQGIQLCMAYV